MTTPARKRALEIREYADRIEWINADGDTEVTMTLADLDPALTSAVLRYGIKQIIADGGAMPAGSTPADRINGMLARRDALVNGTWGTPRARMVDGDIFLAAVRAGLLADTPETRETWRGLKPTERRAIGAMPEVREHLTPSPASDASSLLAKFA